ncbi:C-Jun-amino-terminal kinase-interacting protein 2 [Pteropus vampyrus]|uniref:C-Jun-amino-terminal kinase-interacting protein 2 n=1 Tax=Pteropus vampyrus TaxID=132908 RepID=A0A6P6C1C4_PTEVA|nr:C-Jun-amino-terminal kinase-interacting protein 2 [Pteropus vampyrus]
MDKDLMLQTWETPAETRETRSSPLRRQLTLTRSDSRAWFQPSLSPHSSHPKQSQPLTARCGSGSWGLWRCWGPGDAESPFESPQDQHPGRAPKGAGSLRSPVLALRPGLLFRPPQDISLEEFDDEDLSEITDDCGLGLSYDSDHCEKDGLSLGRSEQPHPICSFQNDLQEFEMIDDNDEDEYEDEDEDQEEEEEGEVGGEEGGGPGSKALTQEPLIPSPAMEEPHKYRPTTLHLTALGAQDSLNNNGGFAPAPPASWPETVLHSPLQESLREPPAPQLPAVAGPCGAQSPVGPGDREGNRPGGPPAPGGASPSSDPGIEADLGSGSSGDEHTQLELVSLRRCAGLGDDSEEDSGGEASEASEDEAGAALLDGGQGPEAASPDSPDLTFSKKFLNVFVNSTSRSSSTESFGLFSCLVNGEEREQTHRAVFRFIPRHPDELELDVDDPVLVEAEEDGFWFRGLNMRTGERGVFPAFYAHAVPGPAKELLGSKRSPCWVDRFAVQFLGSVEVPCHQGNGILCAAMQKIATARKLTVHLRPPASCDLEISLRGVKLSLSGGPEFQRCSHFFQMKNISFCGCHPRNSCYFGFITKHPLLSRFACHVFVSQESMRPVAQSVGRAFLEYYQEHLEYACPTEDIYLE